MTRLIQYTKSLSSALVASLCLLSPLSLHSAANPVATPAQASALLSPQQLRQLDRYFDALEKHQQFMGSVAMSQNGQTIFKRSLGVASVNPQHPIKAETQLRIGSISKVFTAVLTFKAIEAGLFSLETPLHEDFPEIASKKITVSDLLNHRSGLHSFTNDDAYATYMTQPQTREQMRRLALGSKLDFEPGTKASYSNSNYVLLTLLLEKRTQKTFKALLEEQIVTPLKLGHTALGSPAQPPQSAYSFDWAGQGWKQETETDMSIPLGAGALVSTPSDLNLFFRALLEGQVVSESSLKKMVDLQDGYGRGLFPLPFNKAIGWGHTGGIDGFSSIAAYYPHNKLALSVVSNGHRIPLKDIALALLQIQQNLPFSLPDFSVQPIQMSPEELNALVGEYSSKQIPLKITLSVDKGTLYAQATGQQAFPLTPYPKREFRFAPAGVRIVFSETPGQFVLHQGGRNFEFKK